MLNPQSLVSVVLSYFGTAFTAFSWLSQMEPFLVMLSAMVTVVISGASFFKIRAETKSISLSNQLKRQEIARGKEQQTTDV